MDFIANRLSPGTGGVYNGLSLYTNRFLQLDLVLILIVVIIQHVWLWETININQFSTCETAGRYVFCVTLS